MSRNFCIFFILTICSIQLHAQGCADAGFCTMGAMRPDQGFSKKVNLKLRSLEIGQYIGRTKFKNTIIAYTADLNVGITDKLTCQVKVPYMFTSGKLGKTNGIGDLSLSVTRNLISHEKYQLNATLGAKVQLATQNRLSEGGRALPMYYQTSLGTNDLVFGISMISKKWLFATGWQKPFNSNHGINNKFYWEEWEGTPQWPYASHYPESFRLKRRADVMGRIQRDFRFSKWGFNVGLLAIYRFQEDEWWDPKDWTWKDAPGSKGLALSLLTGIGYNFSTKHSLKMANGFRLIRRDANPDGLSREYVNTINYFYKF